jgi:UDP-N-acetylglucosamine 2-epimerase (non-hydrolysing)
VHRLSLKMPVLFPIHPRTASRIAEFGLESDPECNGYTSLEPIGYHESIGLMDAARLVLTDSGGVQEETTVLRVPCLTLRENTERPATITEGSNRLIGWRTEAIDAAVEEVLRGPERVGTVPQLWDGRTAERIAEILKAELGA